MTGFPAPGGQGPSVYGVQGKTPYYFTGFSRTPYFTGFLTGFLTGFFTGFLTGFVPQIGIFPRRATRSVRAPAETR